jgi:RNA-directed DNA polymerase
MNRKKEEPAASVTERPQQAAEALRQKWHWVEPLAWTDCMLQALETGPKGGKWFRLSDKVESERVLRSAFYEVLRNDGSAGVDRQSVAAFERQEKQELANLVDELKNNRYCPLPVRRVYIEKPGSNEKRPLGIPAVRDRTVQGALRKIIEPIFEREFANQSYGFRPGRGCKDALARVDELLKAGYTHVVDADLKGYFDSIPHEELLEKIQERVADGRILGLIEAFLKAGIMEEMKGWEPSEKGTPQGAVVSPLLANVYLNNLDWTMLREGFEMVRYADDCAPRARGASRKTRAEVRNCTTDEGKAPRNLLAGAGSKSPSAAAFKGRCGEHRRKRPGKNRVR